MFILNISFEIKKNRIEVVVPKDVFPLIKPTGKMKQ